MSRLIALKKCGQSYWLDNLTRDKIESGELKERIEKEGLAGITSNPAIFHQAIANSDSYDQQIKAMAESKPVEIYESLVINDIQKACDVLKSVYTETAGVDGFVSLEVSPHLARDTEGTMIEARRLFALVNRPNCLIKIPGTKEGIPAIEQMLYEGININVTLLFSVSVYEEVAKAYVRAMERRKKEGKSLENVRSVASFFLSRIDVLLDKQIEEKGKIAIASAKMAYQSFLEIFSGDQWESLAKAGAKVQRPLWASTSTKNPQYRDVMYVEPLIGRETVNTMPDKTAEAFDTHGEVIEDAILFDIHEAKALLDKHETLLKQATDQLVQEGIQKFIDPFDELLAYIRKKVL